jgi:translation elongation factor EF-1alpha
MECSKGRVTKLIKSVGYKPENVQFLAVASLKEKILLRSQSQ